MRKDIIGIMIENRNNRKNINNRKNRTNSNSNNSSNNGNMKPRIQGLGMKKCSGFLGPEPPKGSKKLDPPLWGYGGYIGIMEKKMETTI